MTEAEKFEASGVTASKYRRCWFDKPEDMVLSGRSAVLRVPDYFGGRYFSHLEASTGIRGCWKISFGTYRAVSMSRETNPSSRRRGESQAADILAANSGYLSRTREKPDVNSVDSGADVSILPLDKTKGEQASQYATVCC
ncbi:hypothetical protein TNCV_5090931 [Trichonephila clavipes]|nr:hypothetical protein TNCV_5090931 [Trichonephila clavipes]